MAEEAFPEVEAIRTLLTVLGPLKPDERQNVLDFVFRKLGMQQTVQSSSQNRPSVDDFFRHASHPPVNANQTEDPAPDLGPSGDAHRSSVTTQDWPAPGSVDTRLS